jgi:RHS repeat-associated protein
VTRSSSGSVTYQVATSQGTATTAVDASTLAVTRRFYDPYGNARGISPSSWVSADENHGYLGKPADSVTGLDLLGARNYDPTLGRFLTPDPVFESGDPNQMGVQLRRRQPGDAIRPVGPVPQGHLRRIRTAHGGDVDQLRRRQYQYLYLQRRHRERHRRRFTDPVTLAGRSSDPGSVPARPAQLRHRHRRQHRQDGL